MERLRFPPKQVLSPWQVPPVVDTSSDLTPYLCGANINLMLRALAILFVSLSACTAGQTQKGNDEIRLRATVQSVVLLGEFSGVVIPVHFDPRFALSVRIESAIPPVAGFASGSLVTFAIHSPSLVFVGEPTKGKTYDFVLHRKTESGMVRFSDLKLQSLADKMR